MSQCMLVLVSLIGAKKIVEIGTLAGYSGVWMARALPPDGKLYTLEKSNKHAQVARASFQKAGVADKVEILEGDARESLRKLSSKGPFDLVFIDADKAKTVLAIKRSMNPGFAGIENELYFADKTLMVFGDAKAVTGEIVKKLSDEAGGGH